MRDVLITRAMRGAECWTDHRMIVAKLNLRMRRAVHLRKAATGKLNCVRLQDTEARNNYRCSVAGKLQDAELLLRNEVLIESKWSLISTSLYDAAVESIGKLKKKNQDWFEENSLHISTLLEEMHNAHKTYLNNPSSESLKKVWHEQRKATQWTLRQL